MAMQIFFVFGGGGGGLKEVYYGICESEEFNKMVHRFNVKSVSPKIEKNKTKKHYVMPDYGPILYIMSVSLALHTLVGT